MSAVTYGRTTSSLSPGEREVIAAKHMASNDGLVRRSYGLPIDALKTTTSLPQETSIDCFDECDVTALWTLQCQHFQRTEGLAQVEESLKTLG